MCNWDEDTVTMAVAAARDCLGSLQNGGSYTGGSPHETRAGLGGIFLASTTLPFRDRQNAGIVANALMMEPSVLSMDITSSQKAGTSGLIAALDVVKAWVGKDMAGKNTAGKDTAGNDSPGSGTGGCAESLLYLASEKRRAKPASLQELWYGDAAAALVLGSEKVAARLVGSVSRTIDFVDHFRGEDREFDYNWEERWVRDEGYMKIVPPAIAELLERTGAAPGEIAYFAMPCVFPAVPRNIAKALGIPAESVRDNLFSVCGETGTAHALILLIDALQEARPGDKVLAVGFGQGCDALLFEATEHLPALQERQSGTGVLAARGVKGALADRREEGNYNKYLTFTRQVNKEFGIRAEVDVPTPLSALYRKKDMVAALIGGKCSVCGTAQFPKTGVCVNPACKATGAQEDYSFADQPAHIKTWTADYLTFTLDPPGYYGMVEFEEGGRFMADFTDVDPERVDVGKPVEMVFRIKQFDERRGFRRYFWKAVPKGV
jgi:3-hydroxy-3-methylglutaryl CoA synthase